MSASEQSAKRRKVKHETYQKWVKHYDRECQTVTWLDCETGFEGGVKLVTKLKCRVCTKYRDRIIGWKNFRDKWISGVDSVRTTNVLDHTKSDQHVYAMNLLRKEQAQAQGASVVPIAQSLSSLSEDERRRLRIFDGRSKVENARTKLIVLGQVVTCDVLKTVMNTDLVTMNAS